MIPPEGVVVIVPPGNALGRHAGVAHGEAGIVPQIEVQLVAGNGPLVDVERPAVIVGHPVASVPWPRWRRPGRGTFLTFPFR